MHTARVTANDGTHLALETSLVFPGSAEEAFGQGKHDPIPTNPLAKTCIVLMHGFSGSSEYFKRNFAELSSRSWVIAPDMRGHGRSQKTRGGYHVARLAVDLQAIVTTIREIRPDVHIYPVGCSIGAAVLWTYAELFYPNVFSGMIFVDQAPLQDRTKFGDWDQSKAHCGLYDEKTLLGAQAAWASEREDERKAAHRDLVAGCLGYRVDTSVVVSPEQYREDEEFFTSISALCDGVWLARLMSDHTRYDHREDIERIDVPVLVMAGAKSGCFPLDGMLETVRRTNKGKVYEKDKASVFDCGHWLFYEEPERFNREVLEFVQHCEAQVTFR